MWLLTTPNFVISLLLSNLKQLNNFCINYYLLHIDFINSFSYFIVADVYSALPKDYELVFMTVIWLT